MSVRLYCPRADERHWFAEADALGHAAFGPSFDPVVYAAWSREARQILAVVIDAEGGLVGYADQFVLAPATAAQVRAGTVREAEFGVDAILSDRGWRHLPRGSAVTVYLAGMCVRSPGSVEGRAAAVLLREAQRAFVARVRARGLQVELLASAATAAGASLLRAMGGYRVHPGRQRRDGFDLYRIPAYPDEARLAERRR